MKTVIACAARLDINADFDPNNSAEIRCERKSGHKGPHRGTYQVSIEWPSIKFPPDTEILHTQDGITVRKKRKHF